MPVDLYVGGAEHAVLHLLYARFWHKVLYDIGVVTTKEPFRKLVSQGMILGEVSTRNISIHVHPSLPSFLILSFRTPYSTNARCPFLLLS